MNNLHLNLDEPRFWIDCNPMEKPFGEATMGIIDEQAGGVIAYLPSEEMAHTMLAALQGQDNARQELEDVLSRWHGRPGEARETIVRLEQIVRKMIG